MAVLHLVLRSEFKIVLNKSKDLKAWLLQDVSALVADVLSK